MTKQRSVEYMKHACHSFLAAFVGWLVPFIGFLGYLQFGPGFGYITDFQSLLFWPLLFTFLGWLILALPLALTLRSERFRSLGMIVLLATASTGLSFLAIAAMFRFTILFMIWWPLLIGIIGGILFWILERTNPIPDWLCWTLPIVFFPFVRFVLLPLGIAFFPYTTHVLGEGAIGREALYRVIESIRVGDTYEDLHRRFPQIFSQPTYGTSSYSGDGWSYSITFDEQRQRVVDVKVKRN